MISHENDKVLTFEMNIHEYYNMHIQLRQKER